MSKAQHTPAPWASTDYFSPVDGGVEVFNRPFGLGKICICTGAQDVAISNARLIAAAPETAAERDKLREINTELLEALEDIIADMDDSGKLTQASCNKARAAIAKARCE